MERCLVCQYPVPLDDVAIAGLHGHRPICLWCFDRARGEQRHVSRRLQHQIDAGERGLIETPLGKDRRR